MAGRLPDYRLKVLNRENDYSSSIGAAWKNDDGSISIQLDHFVVLKGRGHGGDIVITLFLNDKERKRSRKPDDTGDDVPF